jgi:hypothetical protein
MGTVKLGRLVTLVILHEYFSCYIEIYKSKILPEIRDFTAKMLMLSSGL